jgi:thiamine-monophosphate kinase
VKPEDRFVEKLRALLPASGAIRVGPGDDAAILDLPAGPIAVTTDLLVEGVDFFPGEDPERLGRRAVAVNLSDLGAVGAAPEFFLLSVAFPASKGEDFPLAVVRGALARAAGVGAHLAGGDVSAASQVVVSVALWGRPAGSPLLRSGARPGDALFLSGYPGQAAAGLTLAGRLAAFAAQGSSPTPRFPELPREHQRRLLDAYRDPAPPVEAGLALCREGLAHAAIDVSDGLGVDAGRLARASGVRLVVEKDLLPVSPALISFCVMEERDPVEILLGGGDDYELLFAAPPDAGPRIAELGERLDVRLTRIGRVEPGVGAVLRDGRLEKDIADLGHDHLEARK